MTPKKKPFENIVGKRENAQVTSIFLLFFYSVFESLIIYTGSLLCGKELTHSHTMMPFDASGKQAF